MKRTHLSVLAVLLTVSPVTKAWDISGNKETYLNGKESAAQSAAQVQVLQTLQQDMTSKFNEIEADLASGDTEAALTKAKSVLDTVKVKTGIDPKNKIQEKFLIATKFPANAKSMNDLSEDQRDLVIRTISNYRGGLYLDIMNLSKRTTLLYIKAFQAQLAKAGGLTQTDKDKIVNDLVKASLVPMPVEDKGKIRITVFDEDVANEDHTYLFNRELKMFLLQNQEIKISEQAFENKRNESKGNLIGKQFVSSKDVFALATKCFDQASNIYYADDMSNAQTACFTKYFNELSTFEQCNTLASRMYYYSVGNAAKKTCFKKFNP